MNVTISPRALADAVSLTGYDEATAARHVIDAYHRAIRTSVTGYSVDCWLLTVRDGVIQRIRQHRVKIGDIYVSYHAIDRANERFRVPKDNAAEWLVDQFNRATFIAVTQDDKGNLGRTYATDGIIIGMDMREQVITTVFPARISSLTLYKRIKWLTRLELRKVELKIKIAKALRLPTNHIEEMSREFKRIAYSLPVHSKIAR
ncbi:hypothetical protein [Brevibacillus borstelensis]|uniref:hypothetical protein n=1 Tax=Brevibacillus borstelensis TaxID=45462 RepID=UPI0015626C84|nr:hypothetical protein [Brevibacillus borstelensis]MBE5396673.1 hypothetical protein [Brevibacillus borstelensis]MCM3560911.1 hypothetical protein [Brevibacillus borstelensis]MCM3592493.1 hypothetical protein [Brevibacillus borstelensis]WNF06369.1 hypothetical protein RFB14_02705 [Brevibacillus borstelensis]